MTGSDPDNCGQCGVQCTGQAQCQVGFCVCQNGSEIQCDGQCTDPLTDADNCGMCGNACAQDEVCEFGACQPAGTCMAPLADCDDDPATGTDGCETDLSTDSQNCGACGNACGADDRLQRLYLAAGRL